MNYFSLVFLFLLFSVGAYSLELSSGVISKGRDTIRNAEQKRVSPIIKSVIKEKSSDGLSRSIGYTNLGFGNNWFRLNKNLIIKGVNVETKQYLGNWPLKPSTQLLLKTEQETAGPTNPEVTNEGMYQPAKMWLEAGHENSSGCLSNTPLRYGDVNGDKLLFVFFDPSVVVFSPKRGKIDINLLFARDDVMPQAQYDEYIAESRFILKGVTVPQYAALTSIAEYRDEQLGKDWLSPAQRSYGKIYIDDFNGDTVNDIIMWRKLYFSRAKTDSVIGYKLDAEMYAHYQIVDGKYQLQTNTSPETVKGWLEGKNLTWQKGFPSKSECAGQEGQLIPEMHDPLLNDPDVLK